MVHFRDDQDNEPYDPPHPATGPNLFRIAWQRKSLIILGGIVGLVVGSLYYAQRDPVYQSGTQVLVIKKRADVLPLPGDEARFTFFDDYLATHQVIIRSPSLISRAVKKHDLGSLKSFAGQGDPTGAIIGSLSVGRDVKDANGNYSNILNLGYKSNVPDDCLTVLNAIVDTYKEFLDETYRNVSDDTLSLITRARDVLQKDLSEKEKAYKDFRGRSSLIIKSKDGANDLVTSIQAKRAALIVQREELQGRLEAIEAALKSGRSRAELVALIADTNGKSGGISQVQSANTSAEEQLLPLILKEQQLLDDFGPDHPDVQSVRKQIQLTREFRANQLAGRHRASDASTGRHDGFQDAVDFYVQSIKQDLEVIRASEQRLSDLFDREKSEARKLIMEEIEEEQMKNGIARTQQLFDTILTSLKHIDIARDFGGFDAKIIAPAGTGWKVEPKALPIFSVAAFLGLLSGFSLAYLAEVTDKSFRTPEEIRRRLGLPVVGHIPFLRHETAGQEAQANGLPLDPVLCTYYRSKSTEAEAYRGVRTALYFSTRGEGHKVIQVTSPNKADGKSTLAANLAICIAQSGKRTVLLDADFRKPRQQKVFGLSATVGLASLITGEAGLPEAILETGVPNLSLIPCGPIPHNPAELLTSPRFKEVLDSIRDQFDFVLIDTPPLLAVTDPCVVAPRVDGVLLVVRVSKNGRPYAERAKEILNTLGATVLGVVVNGVGRQGGYSGYSYGTSRYNYMTYSYGYHQYGDGNDSYYADKEPTEDAPQAHHKNGSSNGSSADTAAADPAGQKGQGEAERGSSSRLLGRLKWW